MNKLELFLQAAAERDRLQPRLRTETMVLSFRDNGGMSVNRPASTDGFVLSPGEVRDLYWFLKVVFQEMPL